MGRTPSPKAALAAPALIGPNEAREMDAKAEAGAQALTAQALLREMVDGGAGEALQLAGRLQMAMSLATVADSAVLAIFEQAKETRVYRYIPSKRASESGDVAGMTLEEFCETYLGRSSRRLREIHANRRLLGEDLFDASEQLGFRERDYRLIKALPDDDREAVKLAIQQAQRDGDQDAALAVLAEFAARQREARQQAETERDAAIQQRDSMEEDYLASNRLLGEAKTRLRRMQEGGEVPQIDQQMASWPGVSGHLTGEIRAHLTRIGLMIQEAERRIVDADPQEGTPAEDVVRRACQMWYGQLGPDLARLREEVMGVENHLERIVGAFAYPADETSR